jgi:hypothetical protein
MKTITAQEWELLWFFEVEPELLDAGVPWIYNDALYRVTRNSCTLTFAVQPAYRDVRLILSVDGQTGYELSAMGVDDVVYRKEGCNETLEVQLAPHNSLLLSMKPHIRIHQVWGRE